MQTKSKSRKGVDYPTLSSENVKLSDEKRQNSNALTSQKTFSYFNACEISKMMIASNEFTTNSLISDDLWHSQLQG